MKPQHLAHWTMWAALTDGVINKLLKFADDTKIVSKVGTVEDVKVLQDDLHKLFQWSKDWQMLFNTDKSKIIHGAHVDK